MRRDSEPFATFYRYHLLPTSERVQASERTITELTERIKVLELEITNASRRETEQLEAELRPRLQAAMKREQVAAERVAVAQEALDGLRNALSAAQNDVYSLKSRIATARFELENRN